MSVLESIIDFLVPHNCVGCDIEGSLLCENCHGALDTPMPVCFKCKRASPDNSTCHICEVSTPLSAVIVAADYSGVAKELVWRLKFTGARAGADAIAACMVKRFKPDQPMIIVPVPTATKRIRQRGYDQAALLARSYARLADSDYLPCLRRYGQKQQRGSNRAERLQQLHGKYEVKNAEAVYGVSILLIDDVATTGATLEAAAKTLLQAGAKQVSALVFARA